MNSTQTPPFGDPKLRVVLYHIHKARLYVPPVIFAVGMIGNVLMFCLMSQSQFCRSSTSFYMRCLAISDSVYLFTRVLQRYIHGIYVVELKRSSLFYFSCKSYMVLYTGSRYLSMFLLVAMTYDRVFAILFPLRNLTVSPMKRAKITCFVLCTSIPLLSLHQIATSVSTEHLRIFICPFLLQGPYAAYVHYLMVAAFYISALSLCVANILIAVVIVRSRNNRFSSLQNNKPAPMSNCVSNSTTQAEEASLKTLNNGPSKRIKTTAKPDKTEMHIMVMLILVTSTYILCNSLSLFQMLYWNSKEKDTAYLVQVAAIMFEISLVLENMNYAINFYTYALPCAKFRRALFQMFKLRKNK